MPKRAAFHARIDDRRAVGGRLEIAALFIRARNARVGVVVEVRQHGVDRLGGRLEPRIRLERVAAAVALDVEIVDRRAPPRARPRRARLARPRRARLSPLEQAAQTIAHSLAHLVGALLDSSSTSCEICSRTIAAKSGSTDGAATVPVTFSGRSLPAYLTIAGSDCSTGPSIIVATRSKSIASSSRFTLPEPSIVMKSSRPFKSRFVSSASSTTPVADSDENVVRRAASPRSGASRCRAARERAAARTRGRCPRASRSSR